MNPRDTPAAAPRGRGTPEESLARLGEPLLATWTVAGSLIAVVYSAGPVQDAVDAVPWLMGPTLWILTALGSGAILRGLPGRGYPAWGLLAATVAGGAADALVVAAGHPWPGLVVGVVVFSIAMALCRRPPRCEQGADGRERDPLPRPARARRTA